MKQNCQARESRYSDCKNLIFQEESHVAVNMEEDQSLSGRIRFWSNLPDVVKLRNRSQNRKHGKPEGRTKRWQNSTRTPRRKRKKTTLPIQTRNASRSIDSWRTIQAVIKTFPRMTISRTRSSTNRVRYLPRFIAYYQIVILALYVAFPYLGRGFPRRKA